jgi:hypothetical protein
MQTTHTPAPWRAIPAAPPHEIADIMAQPPDDDEGVIVATVYHTGACGLADAALIAAAPAMKEVLEEVDVALQSYMERQGDNAGRLAALRGLVSDALAAALGR